MLMLSRRLQVLIDDEQARRLEDEAGRRSVSVATIVREALDLALPVTSDERAAAATRLLEAPTMAVPSVEDLRAERDEARSTAR